MPRRRRLSPEDQRLWAQIAASATPLHPQQRLPLTMPNPPAAAPAPPTPAFEMTGFRVGETAAPRSPSVSRSPAPGEALRAAPVRMDDKVHRRMVRGKVAPEARIDLHGMTLNVAQPELTRFVLGAHAAGRRLLLVITGKGRSGEAHPPLPVRPGALRHHVPHWLHSPPLAALVLQVVPAHRRHGGDGAYYVYLRR